MKRILFSLACMLIAQASFAAGFALYEGSARGNALGGLTAQADDAAAIFFNPSGMTQLEGTHVMAGVSPIAPWADIEVHDVYSNTDTDGDLEKQVFTPPHIYITHQLNDKVWVGGGVYSRFGLGTKYERNWAGRYSNINTQIQTVTFAGEVAYKVNDNFSVGFGLGGMVMKASLEQAVDANRFQLNPPHNPANDDYDAIQKIKGESMGFGWDVSAHYRQEGLKIGFMYTSKVDQDLEGTARWTRPSAPVPFFWFNDSEVEAETIELPEMYWLGVSYDFNDKLSGGVGVVRTAWGNVQELVFHYDTPFVIIPQIGDVDVARRELNWKDVNRYNFGLEYKFNDTITLMGGGIYDVSPLNDETTSYLLPTNTRTLIDMGISKQFEKWLFTASYNHLRMKTRHISDRQIIEGVPEGTSKGGAHIFGFSMSRKF